jgi:hypothetical protein
VKNRATPCVTVHNDQSQNKIGTSIRCGAEHLRSASACSIFISGAQDEQHFRKSAHGSRLNQQWQNRIFKNFA